MPPTFNSTFNEYVHELQRIQLADQKYIIYEPLENTIPCILYGKIYGENEAIIAEFQGNLWEIHPREEVNSNGLLSGSYDSFGNIKLEWDKYPGIHFLCVSYNWISGLSPRDLGIEDPNRIIVDWKQEGF